MKKIRILLVFLLFALFASIFSLQKFSLSYSEPIFLIGFRMFFSGLSIIIILFFFNKLSIKKNDYKLFFYLSIFNIFLTNLFEIKGLQNMNSSKACLIYSLSPFLTAVISFFVLKDILNFKKIIGLFLGFLGIIPIIFQKSNYENDIKSFLMLSLSELNLFLAVFFSVVGWIILKKILNLNYSFLVANGVSMFLGGIYILLASIFFKEEWTPMPIHDIKNFLFFTFLTAVISNIICYNLFGYLLKYFSNTFMTFAGLMTPLFAAVFGYIILNEKITLYFFLSVLIFFIGLFIFYSEERDN